jgi:hypothetical protein
LRSLTRALADSATDFKFQLTRDEAATVLRSRSGIATAERQKNNCAYTIIFAKVLIQ